MASTICVDESMFKVECMHMGIKSHRSCLPTRLSTKLILRSVWRFKAGGHPVLEIELEEVRLGFWRIS